MQSIRKDSCYVNISILFVIFPFYLGEWKWTDLTKQWQRPNLKADFERKSSFKAWAKNVTKKKEKKTKGLRASCHEKRHQHNLGVFLPLSPPESSVRPTAHQHRAEVYNRNKLVSRHCPQLLWIFTGVVNAVNLYCTKTSQYCPKQTPGTWKKTPLSRDGDWGAIRINNVYITVCVLVPLHSNQYVLDQPAEHLFPDKKPQRGFLPLCIDHLIKS